MNQTLLHGEDVRVETSAFYVNIAVKFLAPNLFHDANLEVPRLSQHVPKEVASLLGDGQHIRGYGIFLFPVDQIVDANCVS